MAEENKELTIQMTGIAVMKDLSLDATMVLYLAYKGLLIPFIPPVIGSKWMELCMSSLSNPPENHVPSFMYRKSDVEEFKLKHKDFWEDLKKQIVNRGKNNNKHAEDTRDTRVKKLPNNPKRLREKKDRVKAEEIADKYIKDCESKGATPRIYEAKELIKKKLSAEYKGKHTIHNWIKGLFPEESRKEGQGRPKKE